jgi:hypothetical protein
LRTCYERPSRRLAAAKLSGKTQEADPREVDGLLGARRERPRNRRAAEQRDERAPSHSITLCSCRRRLWVPDWQLYKYRSRARRGLGCRTIEIPAFRVVHCEIAA